MPDNENTDSIYSHPTTKGSDLAVSLALSTPAQMACVFTSPAISKIRDDRTNLETATQHCCVGFMT
jgi:hypothetical protein